MPGDGFTVGGMAKGAAMLAPNMATMLAVLHHRRRRRPGHAAAGAARGGRRLVQRDDGRRLHLDQRHRAGAGQRPGRRRRRRGALTAALSEACGSLAEQMVDDAEGATKVSHIRVVGARERRRGPPGGPQGGRLHARAVLPQRRGPVLGPGRQRARFGRRRLRPRQVSVAYGGVVVCAGGVAVDHDAAAVAAHMAGSPHRDRVRPRLGHGTAAVLGTDLGYGYIDENRTTS